MTIEVLMKLLGLLAIISVAAYLMSVGAERLSERFGPNFAGSIVLALITVLPEYFFVFFATLKGEYGVALGSITGACSMLVTLGYGVAILTATTRLSRKPVKVIELSRTTQVDATFLSLNAIVAWTLAYMGDGLTVLDGLILAALFFVYVRRLYGEAKRHRAEHRGKIREKPWKAILFLIAGGAVVLYAAEPFIEVIIETAHALNVAPIVIALIISPIATELPEKLTAFVTAHRDGKLAEISVCNFIGSTVNHNSLLIGLMPIIAAFAGGSAVNGILSPAFHMMTGFTLIAAINLFTRRLRFVHGLFFAGLYLLQLWISLHHHNI